jgi:glycosyltransferase involved in cell wall biosynthesis
MKILLVSSGSGSRGGGEIFLKYLGEGLTERRHEVVMWIPNHPRMDELAAKCARFARIIRADYRNTYDYRARSLSTCFNWGVPRRVAGEWKALRPDVIHINKQNLEDGLDLLRAAQRCGVPSVCTIHLTQTADYLRAKAAWLRDQIARWQLSRYKGVLVAVQEGRCRALRKLVAERVRTKTILNGVPRVDAVALRSLREAKRKALGFAEGDFVVLGLGRLVAQKRPFLFLHIAKELHKQFPAAKFLWVGDGELAEQWKRAIAREKLDDVVSCAGWQADVLPFLLAGDLLLHVARFEGLPFALIEAMAAGLPCAVTRGFSFEMPFFNEENILLVDGVKDLAERMRNPLDLAHVAGTGRHLIENKLSVHNMVKSYEQLYLDVTERPAPALSLRSN